MTRVNITSDKNIQIHNHSVTRPLLQRHQTRITVVDVVVDCLATALCVFVCSRCFLVSIRSLYISVLTPQSEMIMASITSVC